MESFVIFKGCHRATIDFRPVIFGGENIIVKFRFNRWYSDVNNIQLTEQINKLWGYSHSWWHKINSERIGWRWSKEVGKVDIFMYRYIGGIRDISLIGIYNINDWIEIEMYRPRFGYTLFPYFGGKEPSPIDLLIEIKIKYL